MYCGSCGTKNIDMAQYCAHCGHELVIHKKKIVQIIANWIKKYVFLWWELNKIDFHNRKSIAFSYLDNKNFQLLSISVGIVSIFLALAVFFPTRIPDIALVIGLYISAIVTIIALIDLFLGRFIYLFQLTGLRNIVKTELIDKVFDVIEENIISDRVEHLDEIPKEYVDKKISEMSFKGKIFYFLGVFLDFHTTIAKKIISHTLVYLFQFILPHTDFDNYFSKIQYFLMLPIKLGFEFLVKMLKLFINWLASKIMSIVIFSLWITGGMLILVYIWFFLPRNEFIYNIIGWIAFLSYIAYVIYRYVRNILDTIILIYRIIKWNILFLIKFIKVMHIFIAIGVLLWIAIYYKLYYLLIVELVLIGLSIFLIVKNILDNFLGISLWKSTYGYTGWIILTQINLGLGHFFMTLFVMTQNHESQSIILGFIQGKYETGLFGLIGMEDGKKNQEEMNPISGNHEASKDTEIVGIHPEKILKKNNRKKKTDTLENTTHSDELIQARKNELKVKLIHKTITEEEKEELLLLGQ